jgi:hypothetical protein
MLPCSRTRAFSKTDNSKVPHWTRSWASSIHFASSRAILKLSSGIFLADFLHRVPLSEVLFGVPRANANPYIATPEWRTSYSWAADHCISSALPHSEKQVHTDMKQVAKLYEMKLTGLHHGFRCLGNKHYIIIIVIIIIIIVIIIIIIIIIHGY